MNTYTIIEPEYQIELTFDLDDLDTVAFRSPCGNTYIDFRAAAEYVTADGNWTEGRLYRRPESELSARSMDEFITTLERQALAAVERAGSDWKETSREAYRLIQEIKSEAYGFFNPGDPDRTETLIAQLEEIIA